jgi:hypothetical protein
VVLTGGNTWMNISDIVYCQWRIETLNFQKYRPNIGEGVQGVQLLYIHDGKIFRVLFDDVKEALKVRSMRVCPNLRELVQQRVDEKQYRWEKLVSTSADLNNSG